MSINTTPTRREMLDMVTNATTQETPMNIDSTIDAMIDRTLSIIDNGLDRNVGDMSLMQAMEFVGVLMDIRERQQAYTERSSKPTGACGKVCTKKPKRM